MTAVAEGTRERVRWGAVALYAVLALGLAWLVALPLWLSGEGLASPAALYVLPAMMATPAIAAVVTAAVSRVPSSDRVRFLGLWPLRPVGRVVGLAIVGLVAPMLVVALTTALAAALGLVRLDLVGFSGLVERLEAATPAGTVLPPPGVLVVAQLAALPLGALVNSVLAAGEEIGWRGWLLPVLRPLGTWPALLVSGAVWGVWHAPVILLGYNFGRPDLVGVALMTAGCIAWGVLFGWLRLRSGSVWPAVLAHGSLNAVAGLVFVLVAAGETPDLGLVGPLGVVSWAVLAVVVIVLVLAGQLRRQPPLGVRGARSAP